MSVESAADRAAMLADFGQVITYALAAGGPPVTFAGIFDAPASASGDYQDSPGFFQVRPQIQARTADLPVGAGQGDSVSVAGDATAWLVNGLFPDGTGMTRIELERAA